MLPYFPFTSAPFAMTMGVQPLDPTATIEIDPAEVLGEIRLKRLLLHTDLTTYYQAMPGTLPLEWEVVTVLLPLLAARYPQWFRLHRDGADWHWENRLLHEATHFTVDDAASLAYPPLVWLARQVQEDLLLLAQDPQAGFPLVAGVLCFPNMWGLAEKLGQSFAAIHAPVPGFAEHVGHATQLLLARMKRERPVWRVNWSMLPLDRLNLTPQFFQEHANAARALTLANIGERCFVRIERQTLTRLPQTGAILFTVHTYQTPLAAIAHHPSLLQQLAKYLATVPPELLTYKGMDRYREVLFTYLAQAMKANQAHADLADDSSTPTTQVMLNISVDVGAPRSSL